MNVTRSVWIRNPRRTRAWAAMATVWSLVFAGLLFGPNGLHGHLTVAGDFGLVAFYGGIAAIGLVFARRVARAGVWIGPDAVRVRGPLRTTTIDLEQVGRFAPGLQGGGGNGTPCPILTRRDRQAVGVWALGRRNVWFHFDRLCEEIQPLCDELNALVDTLRPAES